MGKIFLTPRPGHRLTVVFVVGTRLNIVGYVAITQLVDACMQKILRDHAALDNRTCFPATSAPTVPDHG
jgi:hypothetical protein